MMKNLPWTKEIAMEVARSYSARSAFQSEQSSLYKYSYRRGWWPEMSAHMVKRAAGPTIWTEEAIRSVALSVKVKKEFQAKFPGAYASARRMGILIDVCRHMDRNIIKEERHLGRDCTKCGKFTKPEELANCNAKCKTCEAKRAREYVSKNRGWKRSMSARRRARMAKASPAWLTEGQLTAIKEIYAHASFVESQTGIKHEVDHIIPIAGKNVCGLHVPWNLAVVTKAENRAKSNRVVN
jgi:hypothetical protein